MPDRLQLAVPCILEQTLVLRFFEQYQYFFVDSTLANGDPQMRVRLAKTISWTRRSTISFAHLDALVFLGGRYPALAACHAELSCRRRGNHTAGPEPGVCSD